MNLSSQKETVINPYDITSTNETKGPKPVKEFEKVPGGGGGGGGLPPGVNKKLWVFQSSGSQFNIWSHSFKSGGLIVTKGR